MFNFIIILVFVAMVHNLCAMEQKEIKPKPRKLSLSLPTIIVTSKPSSPNSSPKGPQNQSPNDSPRLSPKSSPKKFTRNDLKNNFNQELFIAELWSAVTDNDTGKALDLINPNMDISDQSSGKTILIMAIKNKNETIVKSLLRYENIDVNLADKCGNTPLHHAVLARNEVIIKLLLLDCRVNSMLIGNGNKIAQALTDHEFYADKNELKQMIDSRTILDVIVNDKAKASSLECLQGDDKDSLDKIIADVKVLSHLPSYATDEFIKNMLLYRIAESKSKK